MKRFGWIVCLAFLIPFSACGNSSSDVNMEVAEPETTMYEAVDTEMVMDQEGDAAPAEQALPTETEEASSQELTTEQDTGETASAASAKQLIRQADLYLESSDFAQAKKELQSLAESHEASVQFQEETQSEDRLGDLNERQLSLVWRMPEAHFQSLIEDVESMESTHLVHLEQGTEDVTKKVRDLNVRIESLNQRIATYNRLMDQAGTLDDIFMIQDRLEEAMVERDILLSDQSTLADQVAESTIRITLTEADTAIQGAGFGASLAYAFQDMGRGVVGGLQGLLLVLIYALPWLLIGILFLWIYRRFFHDRLMERKEAGKAQRQEPTQRRGRLAKGALFKGSQAQKGKAAPQSSADQDQNQAGLPESHLPPRLDDEGKTYVKKNDRG